MIDRNPIVLCVDDERSVLSAVRRLLWFEPYQLVTTQHADEALAWMRRSGVRLIIVDQRMPEMAGTDLLREARRLAPSVACMVLTAYPDREIIRERLNHQIDELVTKPWNEKDLKNRIRRLLDREGPNDASIVIDCHGRTAEDLYWELMPLLRASAAEGGVLTVTLDHREALPDLPAFLVELHRRAVAAGAELIVL